MRQMKYNTYKAIMFGYDKNYTRDMCKLYNQDTKNVIMSRYIKWKEQKTIDPEETTKMFCDSNGEYLLTGIYEDKTPLSYPEYQLPRHVIPNDG